MATYKDRVKKNDGSYIFSDFSKGLYLIDTPRGLGEQLGSLALTGGRNIWAEKGALVSQHGYMQKAELPVGDVLAGYTTIASGNNTFFVVTLTGQVYLYTAYQGLKKYKTEIANTNINPLITRRGKDMVYSADGVTVLFGGYQEEADFTAIVEDITMQNFGSYYQFTVPLEQADYFWNDKELSVDGEYAFTVTSCFVGRDDDYMTIKCVAKNPSSLPGSFNTDTHNIGEQTGYELTLTFQPDNTGVNPPKPDVNIDPQLIAVANNRLFVVHSDGNIYYSQIGVVNGFQEALGAGYFGGFYDDTTETLSIEDYMDGILITKQNGIYYLTIGDTVVIKKISQVGQQYASDHVIVGEKVYAYDVNSGAIVNAVSVNVFGAMVSGKPIISAEYLNAENLGINATRRWLTYNSENEVFILYYGEMLNKGIVLTNVGTLFPRELDKNISGFIGFNQGVIFITDDNKIFQDFKKGTIIPDLSCIANFEAIGVRDNRLICSSLLEVTELNGVSFDITVHNAGSSYQRITPPHGLTTAGAYLPPFLYSDDLVTMESFELTSRWAEKNSNVTRISAPMSGREGISISIEFPKNTAFCLAALRLPDFSQGA